MAQVEVSMTAQPQRPLTPDDGRVGGLKDVSHVIAVSSCKGGVHKGLALGRKTSHLTETQLLLKRLPDDHDSQWGTFQYWV